MNLLSVYIFGYKLLSWWKKVLFRILALFSTHFRIYNDLLIVNILRLIIILNAYWYHIKIDIDKLYILNSIFLNY